MSAGLLQNNLARNESWQLNPKGSGSESRSGHIFTQMGRNPLVIKVDVSIYLKNKYLLKIN